MFERGKVILVPFPFTDLSSAKIRPAVIVSDPKYCPDDISVVFVSSKTTKGQDPTVHFMPVTAMHFQQTGFKTDSMIRCNKVATLDKRIVLGEIGSLHPNDQKKIDQKLKLALGL